MPYQLCAFSYITFCAMRSLLAWPRPANRFILRRFRKSRIGMSGSFGYRFVRNRLVLRIFRLCSFTNITSWMIQPLLGRMGRHARREFYTCNSLYGTYVPPSDEDRRTIISGIEFQQRSLVWSIMSRGVQMTSTIPAGNGQKKYPRSSNNYSAIPGV